MSILRIKIKLLRENARIPCYMSGGSSGMDLVASIDSPVEIKPHDFCTLPTGIAVSIPAGYEGQIRARSGLASKYGIGVLNAPGTIDSDYRGEIKVILFNFGKKPFLVHPGDRIAQLVISPVVRVKLEVTDELDQTERGKGGFGHTGIDLPQT